MSGKNYTIPAILLVIGGILMMFANHVPWWVPVLGAVSATVGAIFLIVFKVRNKYLYKYPFKSVTYRLHKGNFINFNTPLRLCRGEYSILMELIPRIKYTVSEVNLRFRLNGEDTDKAIVNTLDIIKNKYGFTYEFYEKYPMGGSYGYYNPHRVVSVNDTVHYEATLQVGEWDGKLELSLRLTTEEFGRYLIRFDCVHNGDSSEG